MARLPSLLSRVSAALAPRPKAYSVPSTGSGGWYSIIREPFAGAWQRNLEIKADVASTFYADFTCKTLIAHDIAKLGVKLMQRGDNDIWSEVDNPSFSPVLREPNHFQSSQQFWEFWILSKLSWGNTYVLKERYNHRVVKSLYVLNPRRVTPLIADDGSVFYQIATDELAGLAEQITVPASEIIHDRMNCLFHPLVGIPPIYAAGLAATQGLNMQEQSLRLFANNATPSGILTAPNHIEEDTAERLKKDWQDGYGGKNLGKVAVLGDGLKFEKMSLTAVEGQLVEQMKLSAQIVCSTYHVPAWKVGIGDRPPYNTAQQMNEDYYSTCVQTLIEQAEGVLDKGLGLGKQYGLRTEFDIDNLLRMDASAQSEVVTKLVQGGVMTPNEARWRFNLKKLEGGDTVFLQQQDIPMSVAASVTEHPNEAKATPTPAPANDDAATEAEANKALVAIYKGFA